MLRFIALLLLCFTTIPAFAADDAQEIQSSFFNRSSYNIMLARDPELTPNLFVMRFVQPVSLTGCIEVLPLTYEMKQMAGRMEIKIKAPQVVKKELVFETECNTYIQEISGDVILNRDMLIDENIKYLTVKSDFGQDQYMVIVQDEFVRFKPQSMDVFKPHKTKHNNAPLMHWFYPEGVVILSAPSAREDVTGQIKSLAMQQGFVEIETILPEFKAPMKTPNTLYMLDQTLKTAQQMDPGVPKYFGDVVVSETVVGPEGPYEATKKVNVLVRLPRDTE